ncbi:cyclin-like protein [Auriculariales sp. MPI-PUGE-AT-0066]|nr:cyclin-like protein [Auriculariales sp. MPI-PUGE-AT-0066]
MNQAFPLSPKIHGKDLAVRLICPDCQDPQPRIVEEFSSGDLVCGDCGLVLGDRITFANDEGDDPSRVGAATDPLMEDSLDTLIGFRDGNTGVAKELQRAANRGASARAERNILTAFREIANMCDSFSLPKSISDIAKQLYKRADEEKLLKTKSLDAVIAACIFIACRQAHVPRTFREICQLTRVPKKIIGQCYKALEKAFNLAPDSADSASGPEQMIVRYCATLKLPHNIQQYAAHVIITARSLGIAAGRSPVSIGGAAMFFTCHAFSHPRNARDVALAAGVSESTLKVVYRLFYDAREDLVKPEWIEESKADLELLPVLDKA